MLSRIAKGHCCRPLAGTGGAGKYSFADFNNLDDLAIPMANGVLVVMVVPP